MTRSPTPSLRMRSSAAATLISASRSGKSLRACSTIGELKSGMLTASVITDFYAMNDPFAAKNIRRLGKIIAHIGLLPDPIKITADPGGQIHLRFVSGGADAFAAAGEMPHFAGTKFAFGLGRNVNAERVGNLFGHFANADTAAAPDIHGKAIELVAFRREEICSSDIFDEGKIARLLAVLIKHGWKIIQQARAKNRDHTGVWIEDRLARSVGTRVAQRDCGDSDLLAPKQYQFFLIDFR